MKSLLSCLIAVLLISTAGVGFAAEDGNEPEEVLIGFEDTPGEAVFDFMDDQGWNVTNEISQINVLTVELPDLSDEAEADIEVRGALENAPGIDVKYVELNEKMYAHDDQEIPWGVERIEAPEAHDESTGEEVEVAILDTGIDPDHETLEVAGGHAVVSSHPPPRFDEDWADDNGRGTHVAGTAAALDNDVGVLGSAPDVELWAVKVLDRHGSGSFDDVAEGIIWAADEDKEVLNMSLGGGYSEAVEDAVEHAYEEGSLMVASAGNDGPDEDSVNYPAAYEEVIAVSATGEDDNIAEWSSRGEEVELAAPGVDILSTIPDDEYEEKSGTSMAAPHVAGVAAMGFDVEDIDASDDNTEALEDIRGTLQDTAEDIGLDETEQGHGLVNAAEAVEIEVADVTISPSEKEEEAWPEEDAIYEFTVENTGDVDDSYDISTGSEWESSVEPTELSLNAGESETVEVTHSVPEDADAGDTDTGILAIDSLETDASDEAKFITTARGYAVEIDPEFQEGSGEAGDTVEYIYTVSNTGTEVDEYGLTAVAEEWDADVEPATLELEADESEDVTVSHTIPDDAEDEDVDTGTLTAESEEASAEAGFETTVQEVSEPKIITFDVSTRTTGPWYRADVEWEVYHEDGELDEVKSELLDDEGDSLDSETTSVSGKSASGEHNLRDRDEADAVRLTVTDIADQETTETEEIDF